MGFINGLLSYLLLLLLFVAVAGVGLFLGITLRKRKDAKAEYSGQSDDHSEAD